MRRRIAMIFGAVSLTLLTAGCNWTDARFFREGVGTDLYSSELPAAAQLQEAYLGYICQQAGLSVASGGDVLLCSPIGMGPREWTLVVQAGMNDIDQRCDAYLGWLDNKRRSAGPILQQIHDMRTATEAIMRVSGVGADPIVIAGTAFGLASATFTNIQSRLLLEVNHATVQTIVLTRQKEYRRDIMRLAIENRPAAIHALRSYLRLCMPFTIETEINNTVTLAERGGPGGVAAGERNRLISPATVAAGIITDVTAPVPRPERLRIKSATRPGTVEQALPSSFIRDIQVALCVPADGDLGPPGSQTRRAIGEYLIGLRRTPVESITATTRPLLSDAVDEVANCSSEGFGNAFEVGAYGIPRGSRAAKVKAFQSDLRAALKDRGSTVAVPDTGVFDAATRDAIAEYRRLTNTGLPGGRNRQVDSRLRNDIRP